MNCEAVSELAGFRGRPTAFNRFSLAVSERQLTVTGRTFHQSKTRAHAERPEQCYGQ